MRFTFAPLLVLGSFFSVAVAQLTINTPTTPPAVFCEPLMIVWGGGTPGYFVSIEQSSDHSTVLAFPELTNNSISWLVTEPVGSSLLFVVRDSTGANQNSGVFTVQGGGPASCSTSSSTVSGSSTPPGSSASSVSTTTSVSVSVSVSATTSKATSIVASTTASTPATSATPTKPASSPASVSSPTGSASVSAPSTSPSAGAAAANTVPFAAAALGAAFLAAVL